MSFDSYLRAKQAGMQEGLNALAMEQAGRQMRRDKQLRNIMAESYTPGAPTVSNALQEGPIRPGLTQVYPDRPGSLDREKMIGLMYQGGFGPEAMQMEQTAAASRAKTGGGIGTYNPRDYTPASWAKFMQTRDPGGLIRYESSLQERLAGDPRLAQLVTSTQAEIAGGKAGASEQAKSDVELMMDPQIRTAIKSAEIKASGKGQTEIEYARAAAAIPGLVEVTDKLSDLAGVATYTKGGQAWDLLVKESGFGSTKGATARSTMTSIVDNQVLPLLRDTFGAAFTKAEGDSLRATLLDIDATPEQKKATLNAFLEQKMRNLETKRGEISIIEGNEQIMAPKKGAIEDGYVFMGGDPADPKNWKSQ